MVTHKKKSKTHTNHKKHARKHAHAKPKSFLANIEVKVTIVFLILALIASIITALAGIKSFGRAFIAVLGFAYLLFVPGYVFVRSFMKKHDPIEKIALSFGLSVLFVIASIMIANLILKIDISPFANFFIILIVIAAIFAVKFFEHQICKVFSFKRKDLSIR